MDQIDLSSPPSLTEVIDEWSENHPDTPITPDDWSMMLARKMARLPKERIARRFYYDLFEFRCR